MREGENITFRFSPAIEALIARALDHNTLTRIEQKLDAVLEQGKIIMSALTEFAATANAALAQANAGLDNIVTDEAGLAKSIQDLKDQIAAGGSNLTPADQAALDSVAATATALAARTKGVADSVPDKIEPPTA